MINQRLQTLGMEDDEFMGIHGRYFSDFGMILEHLPNRMT